MKPIFLALSIIDIIAGLAVLFSNNIFYLGLFIFLKSLYSIILAFSQKYFFDWMGYVDFVTGLILMFSLSFSWFGILTIVKGIYSLIWSLV